MYFEKKFPGVVKITSPSCQPEGDCDERESEGGLVDRDKQAS